MCRLPLSLPSETLIATLLRSFVGIYTPPPPASPRALSQVLYHKSGRLLLVSCGLIAFYTMSVGMWLFTITSPYFFWFGVPTVFLMFYLICHCECLHVVPSPLPSDRPLAWLP